MRANCIGNKKNNEFIKSEKEYIYVLKFFAVISIVSAHCSVIGENDNKLNILFSYILDRIGSIGVGVFFIISGYLFFKNKDTFKLFILKKIKNIFIPWIVIGTLVYLYIYLRKYTVEFSSWIRFLFGDGSYLYYLTLLNIYYIFLFKKKYDIKYNIFLIFIWIVSIIATSNSILSNLNPYLNPFNFIGYFSIGLIIHNYTSLIEFGEKLKKHRFILVVIYIALLIVINKFNISSGYFGKATLIMQPIGILLIFSLANMECFYKQKIKLIGSESFAIYLLHMPVAGIISNIFTRLDLWILTLFRPFIVIFITMVFIRMCKVIGHKLDIKNYINIIFGIRA